MTDAPKTKLAILNTGFKKVSAAIISIVAFLGAVTSLLVNAGRLSKSEPDTAGSIQLLVSLAHQIDDENMEETFDVYDVEYQIDGDHSHQTITYTTDYFNPKTKQVGTLGEGPFFNLPNIGLDIKLVNNSDQALFLTDAVIDVTKSQPDNRPIMAFTHHEGVIGEIEFTNEGWGDPTHIEMNAEIMWPAGKAATSQKMDLPYRKVTNSETGSSYFRFDISPLIEPYGISNEDIKTAENLIDSDDYLAEKKAAAKVHIPCMRNFATPEALSNTYFILNGEEPPSDDYTLTDEMLSKFPYGCSVRVKGQMTFQWEEKNTAKTQTIEFETDVSISSPEGLGSTGFEPTGQYDVVFNSEEENYTLNIPLSQTIAPKNFDRFTLWMGAPQSSRHQFTLRLKYNGENYLTAQPMTFDYLKPRENALFEERAKAK